MTLKKWLVSLVVMAVSAVAFALPTPPDDHDPVAEMLQQYSTQIEEMNRAFDKTVLPPLKELLQLAQEFGASGQEELTPAQEQTWTKYQTQLLQAFTKIVTPLVEEVDLAQFNETLNQVMTANGLPAQTLTKQDLTNAMIGMAALNALGHFAQDQLLTEEEVELATLLFFPPDDEEENQ